MSTPNTQIGDKTPNKKFNMNNMVQSLGILPVLILLCVGFSILAPNFATESNLMNIVRQSSINMVLAAGMTFIIITGGIDLSVGSLPDCYRRMLMYYVRQDTQCVLRLS